MEISLKMIERTIWQQLAPSFLDYRYQQLWDFGTACADRLNAKSEHIAIYDGTELIGLADVRIKMIPFLKTGIAYINGGPIVRMGTDREKDIDRLNIALTKLADTFAKERKLVLRIQPPLGSELWNDLLRQKFQNSGYVPGSQLRSYRTLVVDISLPLDDVRKNLNQKWRNCLNSSEKKGLTIKTGTDESFFSIFISLYNELKQRKNFDVDLTPEFFRQVQQDLSENERFLITLIYEDEQPVSGHVASILGDTCIYLLGATTDAGLKKNAAYLAQWSVIQTAKDRGCKWYDLGGIDPEENPGVYHFKKGLAGSDVTAPGPYEYYPDNLKRFIVSSSEKVFKIVRYFLQR